MNPEDFRKTITGLLQEALFEANYEIWVDSLPQNQQRPYLNRKEKAAHFFVKKYGWPLDYCRQLTPRDVCTLLHGEYDFHKLPTALQAVSDEAFDAIELFSVAPKYKKQFLADRKKFVNERRSRA